MTPFYGDEYMNPDPGPPWDDDAPLAPVASLPRRRLLSRDDLDHLPAPDWLIDGVLPEHGVCMLSGRRSLGKTAVAVGIAGAVATDEPTWLGHDVNLHGPVLYLALEGFFMFPERLRAWETWSGGIRGPRRAKDLHVPALDHWDLKRQDHADLLAGYALECDARLVVIDSARASGTGAEDTTDMGKYVKSLEWITQHTTALVLVLHNAGLDGTRERGSTLLGDACEAALHLDGELNATIRTLKHTKNRDGEPMVPINLMFRKIDGTDHGVLVPTGDRPGKPQVVTSLDDLIVTWVTEHPQQSSTAVALGIGKHRASVSTKLNELGRAGRVRNQGTGNHPSWVVCAESPLL